MSGCLEKRPGPIPRHSSGDRSAGLSRCLTSRTGTSGSYAQSYRTLRPWHVQHCRPRTAPVRAANRQLKILAGGGIFPVDPAVPQNPGRGAHPHGSGQLSRIRTSGGVSPRPATLRIGRRSLYSAVPRGIQVEMYIPPHSKRSTGVLVTLRFTGPRRLALQDRIGRRRATIERTPYRRGIPQGAIRALESGGG